MRPPPPPTFIALFVDLLKAIEELLTCARTPFSPGLLLPPPEELWRLDDADIRVQQIWHHLVQEVRSLGRSQRRKWCKPYWRSSQTQSEKSRPSSVLVGCHREHLLFVGQKRGVLRGLCHAGKKSIVATRDYIITPPSLMPSVARVCETLGVDQTSSTQRPALPSR